MSEADASEKNNRPEPSAAGTAGAASKVFISFASQDIATAERLCAALEAAGQPCWMAPRDVRAGESYASAIVQAINTCSMLVVVLSKKATESSHVLREVERASSKKRPVLAVRIDASELPLDFEYFLSAHQWLDASDVPVEQLVPALLASGHLHPGAKAGRDALEVRSTVAGSASGRGDVASSGKPVSKWGTRAMAVALAMTAVGLGYVLVDKLWLSKHVTTVNPDIASPSARTPARAAVSEKSIAVLPFTDLSEKKDQEYFADGMAEEVRNLLVKIPGLLVIGRASSLQLKGTDLDSRSIGAKLGAAFVVAGSVRRTAERVRVTAQLIDAREGTNRWSETYDRPIGDTLQMQAEIAASLARTLQVSVGADRRQSRRRPIDDTAYDLYLRGRNAYELITVDGLAAAVTYLQQALDIDPSFSDAAAALAETKFLQANAAMVPSSVGYEQARTAAEAALKLDPSLGLAHALLGAIHADYDRDWIAADREFREAVALAPHDAAVLKLTAELPFALGQNAAARRIYKQSLAADPLSPDAYYILSYVELRSGNLTEALAAARRAVEIAPDYDWGHATIGFVLLLRGEREAALQEIKLDRNPLAQAQGLAVVYYALGRKSDSDAALKKLVTDGADSVAYEIAAVYCYRHELDEAMSWLDRAYAQRDAFLIYIKGDPSFKNLETDPRFKAYLRKLKLPE